MLGRALRRIVAMFVISSMVLINGYAPILGSHFSHSRVAVAEFGPAVLSETIVIIDSTPDVDVALPSFLLARAGSVSNGSLFRATPNFSFGEYDGTPARAALVCLESIESIVEAGSYLQKRCNFSGWKVSNISYVHMTDHMLFVGTWQDALGHDTEISTLGQLIGLGSGLSCLGRYGCVFGTACYQSKLPPEQEYLAYGGKKQEQRKTSEPFGIKCQVVGLICQPLRIVSEPFFDRRLLKLLFPVPILLLGLGCGLWGGENFYRKRYFIGAALVGCGWLCGLAAWWLSWLLG